METGYGQAQGSTRVIGVCLLGSAFSILTYVTNNHRTLYCLVLGFGCCSMFWLLRNQPDLLYSFDHCGTIMDFMVYLLCKLEKPIISNQNANSFGYYDADHQTWCVEA